MRTNTVLYSRGVVKQRDTSETGEVGVIQTTGRGGRQTLRGDTGGVSKHPIKIMNKKSNYIYTFPIKLKLFPEPDMMRITNGKPVQSHLQSNVVRIELFINVVLMNRH